jgi:hypothetical protein
MSDRAAFGGRSAENRDAENNYACMNGPSREQHIWQSPSVLPRTITNAHRRFRFLCPRLRLALRGCIAAAPAAGIGATGAIRYSPMPSSTERHCRRATIRASGIRVGRRNENFCANVQPQWREPLEHRLMAWQRRSAFISVSIVRWQDAWRTVSTRFFSPPVLPIRVSQRTRLLPGPS